MNEHEIVRGLLPLAASGDLSPEESRRVREHLTRCEACRRVSGDFVSLAGAMRDIPTPQPRAELVARVRKLAEAGLERNRARTQDGRVVAPLVAAAWVLALATWPLVQAAGVWVATAWHVPSSGLGTTLTVYSFLGFVLAAISTVAVAMRARATGRTR